MIKKYNWRFNLQNISKGEDSFFETEHESYARSDEDSYNEETSHQRSLNNESEKLKANKTSGFEGNQQILSFLKDLYSDYSIYNNHLTFFDKSFTSPLSRTGVDVYNYVLRDSANIDNKKCYNILFYPRRKNELTFKGDFWVNDTTFAIKKINMAVT